MFPFAYRQRRDSRLKVRDLQLELGKTILFLDGHYIK